MFRNELAEAAAVQLGYDYSCRPDDFFGAKNVVTESVFCSGRREITEAPDFFRIATMGCSAVASADKRILPFVEKIVSSYDGAQLFTGKVQYLLNCELQKYNKIIGDVKIYYLPVTPYKYYRNNGFNVRVYEQDDIVNVLYDSSKKRSDILAVCALNGNNVIGMAGASTDSERFWQIGIDVLPGYRGMGVATEIVSALTYEVFMHGAVPYYGTWSGNIASQNTARKCGYVPVWTEMIACDID